jgi:hypothetical protein
MLGPACYVNTRPGGTAIWKKFKPCIPFVRVMIIDENLPHHLPTPHCDYIYVTIKYMIDSKKITQVLAISDSIMYDQLKRELTVRCGTLEDAVATAILVNDANKGLIDESVLSDGTEYKRVISNARKNMNKNIITLQCIKDSHDMEYSDGLG